MIEENTLTIKDSDVRRQYDEKSKRWYFSVVDVIAVVTESSDPRNYWKVLKSRLNKANPQLVTACNQLKMPSSDGKSYLTDTADSETMIEIVATISSNFVSPFRLYFEKIETSYPHSKNFLNELDDQNNIELPIDMYLTPTEIIIESLVAGSQVEDIFISVTYKTITIKGKRTIPESSEKYLTQEIYWGTFSRTIELPAEIHLDHVEATVSHGVLIVRLQKIDTLRNRIIKPKVI